MNLLDSRRFRVALIWAAVFILSMLFTCPLLYCGEASQAEIEAQLVKNPAVRQSKREMIIQRPNVEYSADTFRDPFKSALAEADTSAAQQTEGSPSQLPALSVQGLIWGGSFPQAIINSRVVRVGDELEGVKITDIGKDGVSVLYGLNTYKLNPPVIAGTGKPDNNYSNSQGGSYD